MLLSRLIPVPMVGFRELLRRLKIQDQMTKQHQTRVDVSSGHPHAHTHAGIQVVMELRAWGGALDPPLRG